MADLQNRIDAGRAAGKILRYAITDAATFNRMVKTADMQKFASSFAQNALGNQRQPNLGDVNASLASGGLPQFLIWDSYVNLESKAGTYTSTTGWEDGNILLSETNVLGDTQHTTTADGFVDIDDSS